MRRFALLLASLTLLFHPGFTARAAIIFDSATSLDNSLNTTSAGTTAPWDYVAQLNDNGNPNASGVYLGYGFVLTANHVSLAGACTVLLNSGTFNRDTSYTPLQIGTADMKLIRILGDPGLSPVPLIADNNNDLGKSSVFIGAGVGRSAISYSGTTPNGFLWGDSTTSRMRWGTNTTAASTLASGTNQYLYSTFNAVGDVATTLGDSGGGLFQQFGGVWKLAGIAAGTQTDGKSLYNPADQNYFVRVKQYNDQILTLIPEPGTLMIICAGGTVILMRRRWV